MMDKPYLQIGRSAQKLRTRRALLEAARMLLLRDEPLTVAAAADMAGISKATAYRYFDTPQTLAMEAMLDVNFESASEVVGSEENVRERVRRVARYLHAATAANETSFRLFLAKALETSVRADAPQLRGARRVPMYELALEPARAGLGETAFLTLVQSLSAATGLEAFIALKDVCRLELDQAEAVLLTTVDALLDAFLKEGGQGWQMELRGHDTNCGNIGAAFDNTRM
jgi:AcrR family transcriptional regulator